MNALRIEFQLALLIVLGIANPVSPTTAQTTSKKDAQSRPQAIDES